MRHRGISTGVNVLRGGHEVISVVLHTDKPGIWDDSKTLLSYGLIKLGCPAEAIVDTTDRTEEPAAPSLNSQECLDTR